MNKFDFSFFVYKLLTIAECLEEAERNVSLGKPINLKNAGRCLADFGRIVFGEIGNHYSSYQVVKELSIKNRFLMLSSRIPELMEYEAMFLEIDGIRNKSEHGGIFIPESSQLSDLIKSAKEFQVVFEKKIVPSLLAAKTPREKFEEDWKLVSPMVQTLEQYAGWRFANYDDLKSEIEHLNGIYLDSNNVAIEVIQEARVELKELQFKMQERIREGEIEYYDALADSYSR